MPGLGHVYLGDPVRGLAFALGVALSVPFAAQLALCGPTKLLCFELFAGVLIAAGLYAWSVFEAYRWARRRSNEALSHWQRPLVYVLYTIIGYVFVLQPFTTRTRNELIESFRIPSSSMVPNILPGDRIFADKTVGRTGGAKLWRGALALFTYPNERTSTFIKRVIGLPGDRIVLDGHKITVNGQDLAMDTASNPSPGTQYGSDRVAAREHGQHGDYTVLWARDANDVGNQQAPVTLVVPAGQVFVLGDNRSAAIDSRKFGTVPLTDIKAVARQVWFSVQPSVGVRWRRIGQLLD
jgi:signal peptidase I